MKSKNKMTKEKGKNKMTKVMIVDDVFVDAARAMQGVKPFDYEDIQKEAEASFLDNRGLYKRPKNEQLVELAVSRGAIRGNALEDYVEKTKNPAFFDLTEPYQKAGGKQNVELLVLGNPVCEVDKNDIYGCDPGQRAEIAQKVFREKNALKTIADTNPDVLILDMGFYAYAPNSLIGEYILKHIEKKKRRFKLQPHCRSEELNFPLKGDYLADLLGYTYRSLQFKGGLILAHALKSARKKFSFWTGDLHHGGEGIAHAYTLDLLSEDEVRQVVASDDESGKVEREISKEFRSKEFRPDDWEIVESRKPISQSENGRVVVAYKYLFSEDGRFKPLFVPKLNRIIEIASRYQKR